MSGCLSSLLGLFRSRKGKKLTKASEENSQGGPSQSNQYVQPLKHHISRQDNAAPLNASNKPSPAIPTIVADSTSRKADQSANVSAVADSYPPKNLWQDAFDKLNDDKKEVLGVQQLSITGIIEEVIGQTKEKYDEYKKSGWKIKEAKGRAR